MKTAAWKSHDLLVGSGFTYRVFFSAHLVSFWKMQQSARISGGSWGTSLAAKTCFKVAIPRVIRLDRLLLFHGNFEKKRMPNLLQLAIAAALHVVLLFSPCVFFPEGGALN